MSEEPTRTTHACATCPARCCTGRFGYQSIRLTAAEQQDPLFAPYVNSGGCLSLDNRACRFLDTETYKCNIYERRPEACRGFVCHDTESQSYSVLAMVYRDRKLRDHLARLSLLPTLPHDLFWAEDGSRRPTPAEWQSLMRYPHRLPPGTWRFFKLDATTGKVELEGRRRSLSTHYEPTSVIRQLLNEKEQAKWLTETENTILVESTPCATTSELKTTTPLIHDIDTFTDAH